MFRQKRTPLGGGVAQLGLLGGIGIPLSFILPRAPRAVKRQNFDPRLSLELDAVIAALENEHNPRRRAKLLTRKRNLELKIPGCKS